MKMGLEVPDDLVEILSDIRDELGAIRKLMETTGVPVQARCEEYAAPLQPAARSEPPARPAARSESVEFLARPEPETRPGRADALEPSFDDVPMPVNRASDEDVLASVAPAARTRDEVSSMSSMERDVDDTSHDDALMKLLGSMDNPGEESPISDQPPLSQEDSSKFDLSMDELEKIFGLDEGKK